MKRSLVLLTFNEITGLRQLFPRVPRQGIDEIFAVDGGSTDGTREFFKQQGVHVMDQEAPGRGAAIRLGIERAQGDAVVLFSPDGNEDPNDIPKLFEALENGADMAVASRFLPASRNEEDDSALPFRKWANQTFTWLENLFWNRGAYMTDTINGYRGLRKSAFEKMRLESNGFTIEYEMSVQAMKYGLRVVEIPTLEGPRIGGRSKAPSMKTGFRFLQFFVKELLRKNPR